jgi:hypothetical protein
MFCTIYGFSQVRRIDCLYLTEVNSAERMQVMAHSGKKALHEKEKRETRIATLPYILVRLLHLLLYQATPLVA